jgi:hypothetical protein
MKWAKKVRYPNRKEEKAVIDKRAEVRFVAAAPAVAIVDS